MDTPSSERFEELTAQASDARDRTQYPYEIPATMPFPEYGESVPVSSVQLVD